MANLTLIAPKFGGSTISIFKRREHLPPSRNVLWLVEVGVVRTYTLTEDGTLIALGFWGLGDTVGQLNPSVIAASQWADSPTVTAALKVVG
jgi:CRP-like cAMP-binding protein